VTVTTSGTYQELHRDRERGRHRLTATIPSTDAIALANGAATVSAQVTDANGNQSAIATQTVDGGRDLARGGRLPRSTAIT